MTCAGIYAARSHHWRMPRAWSPPWREGIPATRSHQVLMGYGLAPAFFTLLFGGHFLDGLCAFGVRLGGRDLPFIWGAVHWEQQLLPHRSMQHSGLAALPAAGAAGFGYDVDTVTIGVLMVLVPGVALTNAMREIMAGDIISGLSRTADAILVASAIALGTVVGLAIGQML